MSRPKPARKKKPADRQTREQYLRAQLREIHADIDMARERMSWQAVAALRRQAKSLREELDTLLAELATEGGRVRGSIRRMPEAEYLSLLRETAESMTDAHLQVVVAVYCDRHGIRILGAA